MKRDFEDDHSQFEPSIVLAPKPAFLAYNSLHFIWENLYRKHLANGKPFTSEQVIHRLYDIYDLIDADGGKEATAYRDEFYGEYEAIMQGLVRAVGKANIRLINIDLADPHQLFEDPLLRETHVMAREEARIMDANADRNFESITLPPTARKSDAFPRDLFLSLPGLTFMTEGYFGQTKERKHYKKSIAGESGAVIHSSNVALCIDGFLDYPPFKKDLELMKRAGIKVGFIPAVDRTKQPPHKQNFLDGHIDGHSNLVTDNDGQVHLVIGESYLKQDTLTYLDILQTADDLDIKIAVIDDAGLPLLAFNFMETPNNKIVYPITGTRTAEGYRGTPLDQALQELVGFDRLALITKPIRHIPRQTKGGVRCMTNVVSAHFLEHVTRF